MKGKSLLLLVLSLLLVLGLGGGIGGLWAKGPEAPGEAPLLALVGSAINYQGRLTDKNTGNPLSGTYDMVFQLWDAATGGTQVGSDISVPPVEVTNGLFNVRIPVTQSWFNGRPLWLRVKVGADDWMTDRQEILPVPYALSLRPGAYIVDEDVVHTTFSVSNGSPAAFG